MSTGMPAGIWLNKFGTIVTDYFGHVPYQVGSSLTTKQWRDVDVRLILPDEEFDARFGHPQSAETNPKLAAITLAFAALGKEMTGLPIDFQIQPASWANAKYPGMRSALIEIRELGPGSGLGRCRSPPIDWSPTPHPRRKAPQITTLQSLIVEFAPLAEEPEPVRTLRGVSLAVAERWLIWLPECDAKDKAIQTLHEATEFACTAATT